MDNVSDKWTPKYPNSIKHRYENWDVIPPIFKFSPTVRKVIYTTNAIESLNSTYQIKLTKKCISKRYSSFEGIVSATFEATKKLTQIIRS